MLFKTEVKKRSTSIELLSVKRETFFSSHQNLRTFIILFHSFFTTNLLYSCFLRPWERERERGREREREREGEREGEGEVKQTGRRDGGQREIA